MIKNILISILFLSLFSCSSHEINPVHAKYIDDVVSCNSNTKNARVLNMEDASDFFSGVENELAVKYIYLKGGSELFDIVLITRTNEDGKELYSADIDRFIFPMTKCSQFKKHTYLK